MGTPPRPTGLAGSVELLALDPESRALCVFAEGECRSRLVEAIVRDRRHTALFVRVTEGGVWNWLLNACPEFQIERMGAPT